MTELTDFTVSEEEDTVLDSIAKPRSILEELRTTREQLQQEHTLDLDIPGYEGKLAARYRTISIKRAQEIGRAVQKESRDARPLAAAMDTLIEACEGIYLRLNDELEPISPDALVPVRFDAQLAELLGFHADSAREVVQGIFPTDHAILKVATQLSRWMQNVTVDLSEDFLGE